MASSLEVEEAILTGINDILIARLSGAKEQVEFTVGDRSTRLMSIPQLQQAKSDQEERIEKYTKGGRRDLIVDCAPFD